MKKLDVKALALSIGVTWGLSILFLGWLASFGWRGSFVEILSSYYIGYSATFFGGIIGGLWAFVDGVIGGLLIGFFYNLFLKKEKK